MDQSITYKQYRDTIMQSVTHGSYHYNSLVELFAAIDDRYTVLQSQLATMNDITDLRISASLLGDAANLVDDIVLDFAQMVATLGVDEGNSGGLYLFNTDRINTAKENAPEVNDMVYYLSSQIADFNELFKGYSYSGVDSINPVNIANYMKATKKVSAISSLVYKQIVSRHEMLKPIVSSTVSEYQQDSYVMEAVESVSPKFFISLIPDVALIDVGETEEEALERAKDYFDGEIDDTVEVMPCSHGMYNSFTVMGEVPDEWEVVNGVVVLPDEAESYSDIPEDGRIDESRTGVVKAATKRIEYELKTKLDKEIKTQYNLKVRLNDNVVVAVVEPDRFLNHEKFSNYEKKSIRLIADHLRDHPWFDEVDVDETKNGHLAISMMLSDVDLNDYRLNLNESISLGNIPKKLIAESKSESKEELEESRANGILQGMTLRVMHEIRSRLEELITRSRMRVGHHRKHNILTIELQGDTIFSDGSIDDHEKGIIQKTIDVISKHPWVEKSHVYFPRYDQGVVHLELQSWDNVDMSDAEKFANIQ